MHYFIYPTADSWISSGSSHVTGESFRDQNFGQDEILELKKEYFNDSFDYETRILINFAGDSFNELSASVSSSGGEFLIPEVSTGLTKYYLRLYEAEGNSELSTQYTLQAFPLSQSWDEGRGNLGDNPKTIDGVSWENRNNYPGSTEVSWSTVDGSGAGVSKHGGFVMTGSGLEASQSFSYQSPDIEMDVTDIVDKWLVGSASNNGFLLRFSASSVYQNTVDPNFTDSYAQLKFFSRNTHTIYAPKLEVRWDNHIPCTGSITGSLLEITMSGGADNYLYMIGLRDSYKESERVKFRVGARKRYIQKSFSTSVHRVSGSFIPEGSGSYSILDVATGETIVPFSAYTSMSCDSTSNYFTQWMNTFEPDRVYKILYKIKYNDGQEQVVDNNFEFKIKR